MMAMFFLSSVSALLFIYLFMPALWMAIIAVDDSVNFHESGHAVVAARNPFRENGAPVCMAKLIMLRHKIHQTNNRKRRNAPPTRQIPRSHTLSPTRGPKASWIRFGRAAGKQYH